LNGTEYSETQAELLEMAVQIVAMDLKGFIDKINHCETIAPLFNPTLYMLGHEKLSQIKLIAIGAKKFQDCVISATGGKEISYVR
jgi:predicted secreted protein